MKIRARPGIYKITCTANGRVYIGSSVDVYARCRNHRWALGANCHCNSHLQNAWNKYGEDAFVFAAVEYVEFSDDLLAREQFWIDKYQDRFNVELVVSGKDFLANYLARKKLQFVSTEFDPDEPLQYLERHLGLGGVYVAKVLGIAYPTYAAYRSGSRVLPRYHLNQVELIMLVRAKELDEYIRERINATH